MAVLGFWRPIRISSRYSTLDWPVAALASALVRARLRAHASSRAAISRAAAEIGQGRTGQVAEVGPGAGAAVRAGHHTMSSRRPGAGATSAGNRHADVSVERPCDCERLVKLLTLAYEGAHAAADEGLIDFAIIGEPLAQALSLLRSRDAG